jgi:opacity protein-like surface antigen
VCARGCRDVATPHGGISMMRFVRYSTLMAVALACGAGVAGAQTTAAASTDKGYAEFTIAATLGHKSDSSVGGEVGYKLMNVNSPFIDELYVFAEGGRMGNVATSDMDTRVQTVADFISHTSGTATQGTATQEVNFFDAGLKVRIMQLSRHGWHPYALIGLGAARVKTSSNFFQGGSDVTSQLPKFDPAVSLGADLAGNSTRFLLTIGAGANAKFGKRLIVDVTYRYGRISAKTDLIPDDVAISTQRVQAGVGIRF